MIDDVYYINDSKTIFYLAKKFINITPSTSNATTTVVNETKVKPVTKTVKAQEA